MTDHLFSSRDAADRPLSAEHAEVIRARLTHEIPQTPAALSTITAQLRQDRPEQVAAIARTLQRAAGDIEAFYRRLGQFHLYTHGLCEPEHEAVDLVSMVEDRIRALEARASDLDWRIDGGPVGIETDKTILAIVLDELICNAADFTPEGSVTTQIDRDGDATLVRIDDTGPGVHTDDLPAVFAPYFSSDRAPARVRPRTGLGLAIAAAGAHLLGGEVLIGRNPAGGCRAVLRVPA
ncbi:MAG: HAMP domain-containing sensor histidine kinase [Pseudomonadota bacterium]